MIEKTNLIEKSRLKIPQFLNLGAVLPTQYA